MSKCLLIILYFFKSYHVLRTRTYERHRNFNHISLKRHISSGHVCLFFRVTALPSLCAISYQVYGAVHFGIKKIIVYEHSARTGFLSSIEKKPFLILSRVFQKDWNASYYLSVGNTNCKNILNNIEIKIIFRKYRDTNFQKVTRFNFYTVPGTYKLY